MKIGILREYKEPQDIRVPLTPKQCKTLLNEYSNLEIVVEPYNKRCFKDAEYTELGIELSDNLSDCDVLLAVKEVPKERFLANKTYFFFSHTIKEQDYNLELMRTMLKQKITHIDHETLIYENGQRIIGFGRWAGIVGAHYAILMMGKKLGLYDIKPANKCHDLEEMMGQYNGLKLPAFKIALTGDGRVGKGALEILEAAKIKQVSPIDFLYKDYNECVFTVLGINELYKNIDKTPIDPSVFYKDPEGTENGFGPFAKVADVLIHGIYWDYRAPILFTKEEMAADDFKINLISDITCDVEGSIPITLRQTAIADPYIGIDKYSGAEIEPFSNNSIDVMAVGNLPNELPRDASTDFGNTLVEKVIPELFDAENSQLLNRAAICKNGALTEKFSYLQDWVDGIK